MTTTRMAGVVTPLRERVAEEVRVLLARRRISASKLARELGVSQTYVWRRLSGETAFDLDDLERISAVLSVSVSDLMPKAGGQTTEP
jgi:transcriptional regulator with XRE-family HTH domain